MISTQTGRDLPALRVVGGGPAPEGSVLREQPDARRAGENVEERVAAFYLEHMSTSSLLESILRMNTGKKDYFARLTPEQWAAHGGLNPTPETRQKLSESASRRSGAHVDVFTCDVA